MKTKYLLVEDDEQLRNLIADELRRSTMATEVLFADSGEGALAKLEQEPDTDLVVLNLSLATPMYGMEVLSRIREFSEVPVVILTTNQSPERQVEARERGADGYMCKDIFDSQISIRCYLETVLKKSRSGTGANSERYSFEGWTLNALGRQLLNSDGAEVTLNSREFDLLLVFVENPRTVLTQEKLIEKLGMGASKGPQVALARVLSRLRKKIDMDRSAPLIRSVHGQGFYFTPAVVSAVWSGKE